MDKLVGFKDHAVEYIKHISSDTFEWLAILFIHCATIPSLATLFLGISDRLPSIDVVIFIWTGLVLLLVRACLTKNMLNILTISIGFIIQAGLLGFLIFK